MVTMLTPIFLYLITGNRWDQSNSIKEKEKKKKQSDAWSCHISFLNRWKYVKLSAQFVRNILHVHSKVNSKVKKDCIFWFHMQLIHQHDLTLYFIL